MRLETPARDEPRLAPIPDDRGAAIEVSHLSKRYRRYTYRPSTLKAWVVDRLTGNGSRYVEFEALADVSFRVPWGQMVAIVGRNGAGKTTLLRTLAEIVPPDRGEVRVNGTVCPLFALGAGFASDLSGEQNVYLYAAMLGLTRRRTAQLLPSIVEFSGVGDFLHEPVKHYSSGMQMRLAFAVIAHLDPDVLLLDEILAVGDQEFQRKCTERMQKFRADGKTIVLVTHALPSVINMCDRAILLDRGRVIADGPPEHVMAAYEELSAASS